VHSNTANFVFGSKQRLHGIIERGTGGVMWTIGALPSPFSSEQTITWTVRGAGDVNGDGCADLIVSATSILAPESFQQIERGWVVPGYRGEWQSTAWDASTAIANVGLVPSQVSLDLEMEKTLLSAQPAGDVDGDRRADLVAFNGNGSLMFYGKSEYPAELSMADADATLLPFAAAPVRSDTGLPMPFNGAQRLWDLDADGRDDLVLKGALDTFRVAYGQHWSGESEVEPELEISAGAPEKSILEAAAGDLDGDGFPELLLSVIDLSQINPVNRDFPMAVYVLRGTGERLRGEVQVSERDRWDVVIPELAQGASISRLLLAGDIDGDGSQDILTRLNPADPAVETTSLYLVPNTLRTPN
jgi:hypothetical protein